MRALDGHCSNLGVKIPSHPVKIKVFTINVVSDLA